MRRPEEAQPRERGVRFADVDEPVLPGIPHLIEVIEALQLPGAGQQGGARGRYARSHGEFGDQAVSDQNKAAKDR